MSSFSFSIRQAFLTCAVWVIFAASACAFECSDVMTCAFEDGSEVMLKATHEWSALGAMAGIIGDVSSRKKQSDYFAYFRQPNGISSKAPRGSMFGIPVENDALAQSIGVTICAQIGKWRGIPLVNGAFLGNEGEWHDMAYSVPRLSWSYDNMPKWVRSYLRQFDGWPVRASYFVAPVGSILVAEQPIGDAKAKYVIRSVYQSISKDGGKTWSAPVLTPHAYIFEIGRVVADQSFVGRPVSYEGRKFQPPRFTKPQTPEEKDAEIRKLPVQWQKVISEAGGVGS